MSELLQSGGPCCAEDLCCEPQITNIPGATGATGAAGTNGTNGVSAFTTLTAGFTMPPGGTVSPSVNRSRTSNVATVTMGVPHNLTTGAVVDMAGFGGAGYNLAGVTVTVTGATTFTYASAGGDEAVTADVGGSFSNTLLTISVATSAWIVPGPSINSIIVIQSAGYVRAEAVPSATTVTIRNLETGVSGIYPDNAAAGTAIPNGSKVSPGGVQGPAGAAAASPAPVDATYITQTPNATLTNEQALSLLATGIARITTGTGVISIAIDGTHYLSPTTGLEPADIGVTVQAFDALLAAIAALVTAADQLIYTTGVNTVALTSLTAAARTLLDDASTTVMRTTLGVQRTTQDILIYQHQLAAGTDAGTFTSGAWQTVPLNTEVADTGGQGSIAANTITLATGVYRVRWHMCAYQVDRFQSRLFNVTTATIIGLGSDAKSAAADTCMSESNGEARITITAATEDIRIEAQCETTNATDGFGIANAFGGTQCYAGIVLEKEVG